MRCSQSKFLQKYADALRRHLEFPNESMLNDAYELGRKAVHEGLGVLDIADLYQNSLHAALGKEVSAHQPALIDRSIEFFAETLSPYEMVLRGYQEANEHLQKMNETLSSTKSTLEALLAAYERAERVSTRFQEAALPEALPHIDGFHFSTYYQPGPSDSVIGGDWYDAMRLADGRILISIGDVGGSGLSAAVTMVMMRQVIRGVAHVHPDPIMILDAAAKTLLAEHPNSYVSAFVGVIDPVEMTLTYASAGHPAPLLRSLNGEVRDLNYEGVLLGIWMPENRTARKVAIQGGDCMVLYTDGLTEASHDVLGGEQRLREAVAITCFHGIKDSARAILHAVLRSPARDDIAILAVHVLDAVVQRSHWHFDVEDARAAQRARLEFVARLRTFPGILDEDIYEAEVVFGELVGNVLRHARGMVDIIVDWSDPAPVLHVRDQGPGFSHAPRLPRDLLSESGRGLYIISAMTEEFNVSRMTGKGSHARAVISLSGKSLSHSVASA